MIRQLSDREHICARPNMYIGGVDLLKTFEYIHENGTVVYKEVQYVPGLIKIINEIIDNSVDVAIKSDFTKCTKISVSIDSDSVQVKDNGTGIPNVKNEEGKYLAELAWGHARAGSNFDDDKNRTQIGMNGVGSFATNCFSKEFIGISDDGNLKYTIVFKDNAATFTDKIQKSYGTSGVIVKFKPDLERFGLSKIDSVHINIIRQRLLNLSMCFPSISFYLNGKKLNVGTFKKYVSMFSEHAEIYDGGDYKFAVLPNADDDFRQFSYVNGLKIPDGGTHIDVLANNIVSGIRDKLLKKYKSIKPGDIKNKLMIIAFLNNVKNPKFTSQSKEKISNTASEMSKYYGEIPYQTIINKIMRNKAIIDSITEVYRIKEELKRRQELQSLSKVKKKVKSDKYTPSIGSKKYLILTEGASASGGLMPVLGRKECGYYELKGKPLNAYRADQSKFTKNKELSDLFKVIQNEGYEYIIFGTDQDLDGIHIQGLLIGFFERYLPDWKGKIGILQTPVITVTKGGKIIRWTYNLMDNIKLKSGEVSNYYKGLGTWDAKDLKYILQKEGLDKMIRMLEFDSDGIISDWLGNDANPRKEYILENDFNIARA